jgi:hypothetical protein
MKKTVREKLFPEFGFFGKKPVAGIKFLCKFGIIFPEKQFWK